ncbi:MAG: dCTP deaminase [Candidatus Zixiibacteriota bacterium]|nr:MAG: dCTP deaminase [candidate division Zixibacteria bacterium]
MPVKSDRWIIEMAKNHEMIKPFSEAQIRQGISFGVSSYGYDISLADEFKILDSKGLAEIDPKGNHQNHFIDTKADSVLIPPNSFVLGRTREYFKIPRDVITICTGKSTYARSGIVVNVTPFEPEWEGYATISLSNTAPVPVRVYANEGVAQLLFLEAAEMCKQSYRDKKGKYQAQQGITTSKAD